MILALGLAGPFLSLVAVRRTGKKILLLVSTAAMTAAALFLALLSHFEVVFPISEIYCIDRNQLVFDSIVQ